MTPPPLLFDEVREWLLRASEDLRTAQVAIAASLFRPAAFHCQQAVEKALKALLVANQHSVKKTHALGELGSQCLKFEPSLQPVVLDGATLSEYASQFRYPGAAREIDQKEAEDALAKASRVFDEILKLVPPQARP